MLRPQSIEMMVEPEEIVLVCRTAAGTSHMALDRALTRVLAHAIRLWLLRPLAPVNRTSGNTTLSVEEGGTATDPGLVVRCDAVQWFMAPKVAQDLLIRLEGETRKEGEALLLADQDPS